MSSNYHNPEIGPRSPIETLMEVRFQQINRATETIADIYEVAAGRIPENNDEAIRPDLTDQFSDLNDRINRGEL